MRIAVDARRGWNHRATDEAGSARGDGGNLLNAVEQLLELAVRSRRGEGVGLFSICSTERFVLEAGMARAIRDDSIVCIESTCNQVNQFGGYTEMTPTMFRRFVASIAEGVGLPFERVVLGGDHLGPWVWQGEPAATAMAKACELVRQCVLAGYSKIHLDASMRCADDPGGDAGEFLDEATAAERTAALCRVAEEAFGELPHGSPAPVYVIGTEVPTPGGEKVGDGAPSVTRVTDLERAVARTEQAFGREKLRSAWERVIAVVAQPGVEFGDDVVFDYRREDARELAAFAEREGSLAYEAHSTDYQSASALRQMVEDHFAILKVGPWLTFAMREALFALEAIERELFPDRDDTALSRLREVLEATMIADPEHWVSYHRGDERGLRLARAFSYSDRSRYYWPRPELREALAKLMSNLSERRIPPTLLSQFLPVQYEAVRGGELSAEPGALVRHKILEVVDLYAAACAML